MDWQAGEDWRKYQRPFMFDFPIARSPADGKVPNANGTRCWGLKKTAGSLVEVPDRIAEADDWVGQLVEVEGASDKVSAGAPFTIIGLRDVKTAILFSPKGWVQNKWGGGQWPGTKATLVTAGLGSVPFKELKIIGPSKIERESDDIVTWALRLQDKPRKSAYDDYRQHDDEAMEAFRRAWRK